MKTTVRHCFSALLAAGLLPGILLAPSARAAKPNYEFEETPSFSDDFPAEWNPALAGWRVATWKQNGTQMSPERCQTDGSGLLIQTVKAGVPKLGGSMQTAREFGFGRWVARVKPSSVPGALNSIFTKDWDDLTTPEPENDGKMGEIDIEFLTYTFSKKHGKVHLAIHLKDRDNYYSVDPVLNFNPSDDFHEWGFDVLPDRVVWHVDGKELHTWRYTKDAFIDENYEFFFNSWTQGQWINGPPKKDARYEIDWVKFYPLKKEAP